MTYDAIIIPGGGLQPNGNLNPWVVARLERALELYNGEYVIAASAGTVHRPPPLTEDGFPIFESVVAARYLVERGLDPAKILTEACSYDTIGNAYFVRVIHVTPRDFRNLLVINSKFHMPRTEATFRWVFGLDSPPQYFNFHFETVNNTGFDPAALQSRRKKEQKSLAQLRHTANHIHTLEQLHRWLFTEHGAYAVATPPHRATGDIVNTY